MDRKHAAAMRVVHSMRADADQVAAELRDEPLDLVVDSLKVSSFEHTLSRFGESLTRKAVVKMAERVHLETLANSLEIVLMAKGGK